jgi:Pyrimidine dimer DNA glycosylase
MRIWRVPFSELDDQRVLGQHSELHGIWGIITRGRRWGQIGQDLGYWSDPTNLAAFWTLHEDIVEEMSRRGFNGHASPLTWNGLPTTFERTHITYNPEDVLNDRWHLLLRWHGTFPGRLYAGIDDWAALVNRYNEQGTQCRHDGERERLSNGPTVCLLCKDTIYIG